MNKSVRQAVFVRSEGKCECGCGRFVDYESGHADHFFGRAKAEEKLETVWFLDPLCDASKTTNLPNATHWLVTFALHCLRHNYSEEAKRALLKIAALSAKGLTQFHAAPKGATP